MSLEEITPFPRDELVENIEFRLETAKVISDLLKKKNILHCNKTVNEPILNELDSFIRNNLRNLLLEIMGERKSNTFSDDETDILRAMVARVKASIGGQQ